MEMFVQEIRNLMKTETKQALQGKIDSFLAQYEENQIHLQLNDIFKKLSHDEVVGIPPCLAPFKPKKSTDQKSSLDSTDLASSSTVPVSIPSHDHVRRKHNRSPQLDDPVKKLRTEEDE
jgi:hypothetical protein